MNSSSARVTAAFFVFSPLNSRARSMSFGSRDRLVAMCASLHTMLHNSSCAVKLSCWARQESASVPGLPRHLRGSHDRIEVEALVPARVAAVEELEACGRVLRELCVLRDLLPEFGRERRIAGEHLARHGFGDVRLYRFLLLEGVVERAPRRERIGRQRLEN